MDNRYITDIILNEIDETRKLVARFQSTTKVPPIFIELALAKLKNIAVELMLLNKDSEQLSQLAPTEVYGVIQRKIIDVRTELKNHKPLVEVHNQPQQKLATTTEDYALALKDPVKIASGVRTGSSYKIRTKKRTKTDLSKSGQDIKQRIELNDKIWFIKELFSGSIDLYNQTLDYLNKLEHADEAMEYLQLYFSWNLNDDTVKDFFAIIAEHFDA